MDIRTNRKSLSLALSLGVATLLGSALPDLDHIPEVVRGIPNGRFAHYTLFAVAVFVACYNLSYLGGLYIRMVLRRR